MGADRDAPEVPAPRPPDGGDYLVTSDEREAAEARLRQAVADDLVSLEEFGDRMRLLLSARTRSELRAAVADLPAAPRTASRADHRVRRPARYQRWIVAVLGGADTRGRWRPDPTINALAVMGGATIDLQNAEFDGEVLVINALALMGAVEVIVPEGVDVDVSALALMGGRDVEVHGPVDVRAPLVQVRGAAVMGGLDVRHPKPEERRRAADVAEPDESRIALRPAGYDAAGSSVGGRTRAVAARGAAVQRWVVAALAALALAVPVGWVVTADDVVGAVFGSAEQAVSASALADGEAVVSTPVAFGSVSLRVPANAIVERDGAVVFGSTECQACDTNPAGDGPVVRVRTIGGFGSVEIVRTAATGAR
jgi:hypothetical protein